MKAKLIDIDFNHNYDHSGITLAHERSADLYCEIVGVKMLCELWGPNDLTLGGIEFRMTFSEAKFLADRLLRLIGETVTQPPQTQGNV